MNPLARMRRKVGRRGAALIVALALLAGGCGGASDGAETAAKAHPPPPAPCHAGKAIAPHVPEAPASWTSGPRPAIALACSGDRVDPGAAIAGYPIPGGGSCVSAYSFRLEEAFDELCELPGSAWTSQCERRGCVHYFRHDPHSTVIDGPAAPGAVGAQVLVDGKALDEGVMFAVVHGKSQRAIGAEEPFGFFVAYIPRCVEPGEVTVSLTAEDGSRLGIADEWDVAESKCPPRSRRPRP